MLLLQFFRGIELQRLFQMRYLWCYINVSTIMVAYNEADFGKLHEIRHIGCKDPTAERCCDSRVVQQCIDIATHLDFSDVRLRQKMEYQFISFYDTTNQSKRKKEDFEKN